MGTQGTRAWHKALLQGVKKADVRQKEIKKNSIKTSSSEQESYYLAARFRMVSFRRHIKLKPHPDQYP